MIEPTDLVLVSVLNDPRDMEIARLLGWYRIPVRSAPRTVAVDWLAFYQTARFGAEKWAIHYAAPVRGHELTTRAELLRTQPDHPRAGEQYFKMQLGPLERLPRPVPSRAWRRITFLYTTGEHLLQAAELNDLIVQSHERDLLWKALRERGLRAERQYHTGAGAELDLALLCALGNLGITLGPPPDRKVKEQGREAWQHLSFPESTVNSDLPGVLEAIEQSVQRLGGLAQ